MRASLRHSAAAAVAAAMSLSPALAAAQGAFQTFTNRDAFYAAALADYSRTPTVVNFKMIASATDLGIADVSSAGACMAAPTFVVSGPAKWIDFTNGSCGPGSLTFTLTRSDIGAFGFFLHPVSIPGGPVTFNVSTSFDDAVIGQSTVSYQLGNGLAPGYFGVLLDPDQLSANAVGLATVTVSTSSAARIGIRDTEFDAAVVAPEPATLTLVGAGLLTLGAVLRRRRA